MKSFYGLIFLLGITLSPLAGGQKNPLLVNGAGASFPYILYSKWFSEYRRAAPAVMINYRSIGSGGGIRQFLAGTLDFGATDVPMSLKYRQKSPRKILHIPTALGAVVLSYNIPSLKKPASIRLTAEILRGIYGGDIKKWNDPKITSVNSGVAFPARPIIPIYRADGSGTTAVFTEYLAQSSPKWLARVGRGKAVNWPTGIGGKGNEGVMGLIRKMPGAIGYIAMSYARNRKLNQALIENESGHFVPSRGEFVKNSAVQVLKKYHDLFHPLTAVKGAGAYPLSSYTYLLVYKEMLSPQGKALKRFLYWALKEGQAFCTPLHYVPLPLELIPSITKSVDSIKVVSQ